MLQVFLGWFITWLPAIKIALAQEACNIVVGRGAGMIVEASTGKLKATQRLRSTALGLQYTYSFR
jgi:hypothetical protein